MIFLQTFEQFSNTNKESVYLRFNTIDKTTFNLICDSDPTSNHKNVGKYTEWLLKLYSFKRLNISDLHDIKRYLMIVDSENIDITNCKSDIDLYKLVKPFLKDEEETGSIVINIGEDLENVDIDFEVLFDTYSFQNENAGEYYRIVLLDNKIYTSYDWTVVDMDDEEIRITDEMAHSLDNIEYSEDDEYSEGDDYLESKHEYQEIERYYNKQLKVIDKIKDKVKYFKSKYEIDNSFEPEKEASKILNQNVYEARKDPNYLKWKRENVSVRGIKTENVDNGVWGSFGKGLYTVFLSNIPMARTYGTIYYLVGAKPKNPKIVKDLNRAEIYMQELVSEYCENTGHKRSITYFDENTSIEKEMLAKGYDGFVIAGREMVNYTPSSDIKYFKTEEQLENYYYTLQNIRGGFINEYFNSEKLPTTEYTVKQIFKRFEYLGIQTYKYSNHESCFTFRCRDLTQKNKILITLSKFKKSLIEKDNLIMTYDIRTDVDIFDNTKNILTFIVYFKDLKSERLLPPKKVYHQTKKELVESILENGLLLKDSSNWHKVDPTLEYPPAIFVSTKIDNLFYKGDEYVIFEIDTTLINNKWYYDLNVNTFKQKTYLMTFEPISSSALTLIKNI